MIWIAFTVDAAIYALVGAAIVLLGRRFLPEPWREPSFTIPLVIGLGLILSLAAYPHWLVHFG